MVFLRMFSHENVSFIVAFRSYIAQVPRLPVLPLTLFLKASMTNDLLGGRTEMGQGSMEFFLLYSTFLCPLLKRGDASRRPSHNGAP